MYSFERHNSPWSISKNVSTISDTSDIRLTESDDVGIISPKTATASPNSPINIIPPGQVDRIDKIAIFREKILSSDIKFTDTQIYNARASIMFNTKMAVDEEEDLALCKCGKQCCPTKSRPFFVLPQYTKWAMPGDLGVVVNLKHEQHLAAYAICADLGPDQTQQDDSGTHFKGKIGEGSIYLGKSLKIKDCDIGDGSQAFQRDEMLYIVFPFTGNTICECGKIYTVKEINEKAHAAFRYWGGWKYFKNIVKIAYGIDLK